MDRAKDFEKKAIENKSFTLGIDIRSGYKISAIGDILKLITRGNEYDICDIVKAGVERSKIKLQYPILIEPGSFEEGSIFFTCNYKIDD